MDQWLLYFESPEFQRFLEEIGVPFILVAMVLALAALLLEIRLPIRYYWQLPGHSLQSILQGLRLAKPNPVWGKCYIKESKRPLPLVAVELLDDETNKVVMQTYSNHEGEYGFSLRPGKYLLRAVKTHYRLPSLLDPENVRIVGVDESFVVPVIVINKEVAPVVDLPLVPVKQLHELTLWQSFLHYVRMFIFQLANVFLGAVIMISLLGLYAARDPFYGVILAVSLVLLFIKLYVLETISAVTRS